VNRRLVLALSLAVIAFSWGRTLWRASGPPFVAPADFSTLVLNVVVAKVVVAAVILALLWAGGESLRTLGFISPRWGRAIARGLLYGVLVFVILNVALPTALAAVLRLPGGENAFGIAHLYQSAATGISAAVSGLAFALIYLRRRSGVEAAASHAFADILGVVAATLLAH
jgi:membrane protease YdiL (CAAX protease family)